MLALPSSASAQATRTWVSGVGDDANPCSRTAPCKTFAGAISKTANGGEINCLDPGGFGGVTITKSLTIKCHYTEGGVLVAGTNAIVVNAAATDKVTLKGLDINGVGVGARTSLTGIKVLSAKQVNIIDNEIYRFQAGVAQVPTSATTTVMLKGNHIHDNGIGFINAPGNNAITFTSAVLSYNDFQDNDCGIVNGAFGTNASTPVASNACGTNSVATGINRTTQTHAYHNSVNLNNTGVMSRGASSAVELGFNEITNNFVLGLDTVDSGILRTTTPPSNVISGNANSDPTNASVALTKRQAKKARKSGKRRY
ncbi:MAG TPA: hypothetical protein VJT75_05235 [Thermoleophilaceae bacterium]|nr:hypothetical protein [Thermoleophilaceae bacterium]